MARVISVGSLFLIVLAGCLPLEMFQEDAEFAQVPSNPFPPPPTVARRAKINYTPAAEDVAGRVDCVGRKLLAEDNQSGVRPGFATIGVAEPEIFHVDHHLVYVTEGLVKQCKNEAQLAAVLASEVGKMVVEREAAARREVREPEQPPPASLPIGGNGYGPAADPIHQVELAKYEKQYPKKPRQLPRPDPRKVAQGLLEKAGYQKADLDAVEPLLRGAEQHATIERQFKGLPMQGGWRGTAAPR